ncbi:hypothetical protein JW960_12685 [candidate division KSB1 bacterium]|nr:hypothetical protein [candidate division KSB1 bacterium]
MLLYISLIVALVQPSIHPPTQSNCAPSVIVFQCTATIPLFIFYKQPFQDQTPQQILPRNDIEFLRKFFLLILLPTFIGFLIGRFLGITKHVIIIVIILVFVCDVLIFKGTIAAALFTSENLQRIFDFFKILLERFRCVPCFFSIIGLAWGFKGKKKQPPNLKYADRRPGDY